MKELAAKLKALADKNRLKMLKLLFKKDYCVRALARELEMSESAVSQHLKKLREVGLVVGKKEGYWVHYTVLDEQLISLAEELTTLAELENPEGDDSGNCCH